MKHSNKRIAFVAGLSALLLVGTVGPSEAGIVILENGEVIVGKIGKKDVEEDRITVRWPYGSRVDRGSIKVERKRVRWHDPAADEPTDAYWKQYFDEKLIGAYWLRLREEYRLRQERLKNPKPTGPGIPVPIIAFKIGSQFEPNALKGEGFSIKLLRDWKAESEDGILMMRAPKTGSFGFRPRIHVFSSKASRVVGYQAQVEWVRAELKKISGKLGFKIVEQDRLRRSSLGADQVLKTETKLEQRTIVALRKVCFRNNRTYFFTAYADARDYKKVEGMFRDCLKTWKLSEDAPQR